MIDDRPTIGERYMRAARSSDLRLRDERPGDADVLIAAGLAPGTLASLLYRLKGEFDTVKAEQYAAQSRLTLALMASSAEAQSVDVGPTRAVKMAEDAEKQALQSRALILLQIPSLREARDRLGAWGVARATFKRYDAAPRDLANLVGRVLEVWLDPLCPPCEGRGFTGGGRGEHSGPRMRCSSCGETGKRRQRLGRDDAERTFAGDLLTHMDRMVCEVEAQMSRFLRNGV